MDWSGQEDSESSEEVYENVEIQNEKFMVIGLLNQLAKQLRTGRR